MGNGTRIALAVVAVLSVILLGLLGLRFTQGRDPHISIDKGTIGVTKGTSPVPKAASAPRVVRRPMTMPVLDESSGGPRNPALQNPAPGAQLPAGLELEAAPQIRVPLAEPSAPAAPQAALPHASPQ